MGTSIKITAYKPDEMLKSEWEDFKTDFYSHFEEMDIDEEYMCGVDLIYCKYANADLKKQVEPFKEKWSGKNIEFNMWFLEADPDETEVL